MGNKTHIQWTDFSSNPLRYRDANGKTVWACAKISPGCAHCYSEALAHRYGKGGPFNLKVLSGLTPYLDEKELRHLLTAKKLAGQRVFLCDMTDLFGEWVSDEMIAALFGVMAARPDVTFQVLTKRASRAAAWFKWVDGHRVSSVFGAAELTPVEICATALRRLAVGPPSSTDAARMACAWPLPNVWIGTSVERQEEADERAPHLLRVPAEVRFLSVEPLLGPVRLAPEWLRCPGGNEYGHGYSRTTVHAGGCCERHAGIGWVIVGGESGPGARPCDLAWIRSVVAQCKAAGVPVFCKQLGAHVAWNGHSPPGGAWPLGTRHEDTGLGHFRVLLSDRKGGDMAEFPPDLQVREFPSTGGR